MLLLLNPIETAADNNHMLSLQLKWWFVTASEDFFKNALKVSLLYYGHLDPSNDSSPQCAGQIICHRKVFPGDTCPFSWKVDQLVDVEPASDLGW